MTARMRLPRTSSRIPRSSAVAYLARMAATSGVQDGRLLAGSAQALLAGLPDLGPLGRRGQTLNERISAAEALRDQCQSDLDDAVGELHYARANAPGVDLAHARALSPDDRHRYTEFLAAETQWERAHAAWESANSAVSRLLAQFDATGAPLPSWAPNPDW